ncbi:MAG: class I SAM-dependent methyltransferase [Gemmatimonadaceae bacterium]
MRYPRILAYGAQVSRRRLLFRWYWWLERRIAPGLRPSQDLYEALLARRVGPSTRWLDLGCGHRVLPEWRHEAEQQLVGRAALVVGTDYDFPSLRTHRSIRYRCRSDASHLPFADESFQLVTANMVAEHLPDPATVFGEARRVLRRGGVFIFHTPNRRSYVVQVGRLLPQRLKERLARVLHKRRSADLFPTYYRANTAEQIGALARQVGLESVEIQTVTTGAMLAVVLPAAAVELLWIRLLMTPRMARFRPNIIATLRKP